MGGRAKIGRNFSTYNQDEIDRLKGILLPEKLKCGRCHKNFNHAKFSVKQLTDVRFQIKSQGRMTKNPNCKNCTGGPVVEIECIMCHKTQGLEEFAKVQRKDPSNAKCYKCVNDQVALDAVNDEKYEDPNKAFITPDHSGGRIPEYFTSSSASTDDSFSTNGGYDDDSAISYDAHNDLNGGIALSNNFRRAVSISDDVDQSLIETEYAYPPAPAANDDWSEVRTKSWHTKSAASSSSGFNPNKYGNPKASAGSVTGKSVYSFTSSQAERSEVIETRASGFAKIRAAPVITRDDTSSSSEEEEVDDDSDDDDDDDTVI